MRLNANLINLAFISLATVVAIIFDTTTKTLRVYAGTTFNFRPIILSQTGFTLAFAFISTFLLWLSLLRTTPRPWIYLTYAILGAIAVVYFPLRMLGVVPLELRIPFSFVEAISPGTYLHLTWILFFAIGAIGLFRFRKK